MTFSDICGFVLPLMSSLESARRSLYVLSTEVSKDLLCTVEGHFMYCALTHRTRVCVWTRLLRLDFDTTSRRARRRRGSSCKSTLTDSDTDSERQQNRSQTMRTEGSTFEAFRRALLRPFECFGQPHAAASGNHSSAGLRSSSGSKDDHPTTPRSPKSPRSPMTSSLSRPSLSRQESNGLDRPSFARRSIDSVCDVWGSVQSEFAKASGMLFPCCCILLLLRSLHDARLIQAECAPTEIFTAQACSNSDEDEGVELPLKPGKPC